jgi:hypothetical protein
MFEVVFRASQIGRYDVAELDPGSAMFRARMLVESEAEAKRNVRLRKMDVASAKEGSQAEIDGRFDGRMLVTEDLVQLDRTMGMPRLGAVDDQDRAEVVEDCGLAIDLEVAIALPNGQTIFRVRRHKNA